MLLVVVAVFFICNILALVINILEQFGYQNHELIQVSNLLVTINSSVNILIYCIFGAKFKTLFMQIFCGAKPQVQTVHRSTGGGCRGGNAGMAASAAGMGGGGGGTLATPAAGGGSSGMLSSRYDSEEMIICGKISPSSSPRSTLLAVAKADLRQNGALAVGSANPAPAVSADKRTIHLRIENSASGNGGIETTAFLEVS